MININNIKFLIMVILTLGMWNSIVWAYQTNTKYSASHIPEELKGLKIEEKLGNTLDLNLDFTDSNGKKVQLKDYFKFNNPVLLSIIYYNCPNLCGLHLNGLMEGLKDLPADFKQDFHFVLVSMDHTETPELAHRKKENYVKKYSLNAEKVHFLTGHKPEILNLSQQVGFRFKWDENQKIFAHSPVAYILTVQGKISRYLYGVIFSTQLLRLSLVEASLEKIGSIIDRVILFCFQFDPKRRRYSWYSYNIMRTGGIVTFILLLFFLIPVWIKENKKLKKGIS